MKKNLKKVISAVIALALTASSVAMAATKFTDVADTASYAQAVNTLSSLGVISGYEDGTFKPDSNITRAEVTTMVVAALNRTADAEGAKGTTKFADVNVEAKAWASGFINIGVAEKFVSGYEDGAFKPDNNVTYAEIVSMLVRIAGYGQYADYLGGWPNGYLSVGADKGITKGVSGSADTAVTRAQVAQMIYNTLMDVPTVTSSGFTTNNNGDLVPELTIMDGKGDNKYETLLTQKHNAYLVEGSVTQTNRTMSSKFDAGEVEFSITYTENYDDSRVVLKRNNTSSTTESKERVNVGTTDAANALLAYATAIIKVDDDGEGTILSFVPSGKNTVDSFEANLIDEHDYKTGTVYDANGNVLDKPYVKYFAAKDSSKAQKYSLDKKFKLYVNGAELTNFDKDDFEKYVVNNQSGKIDLIDRYSAKDKADGYYDVIFATYYATAKVGSVNLSSGKITFNKSYNADKNNITLDPEDKDKQFDIFYNGEKVETSALQVDDVISIAYDVSGTIDVSDFYEIHISREKADGKFTGKNDEDKEATIGEKTYEFVGAYSGFIDKDPSKSELQMSSEYTVYLDAFGRIFDVEKLQSSDKFAIIDKYTRASADDYYRALLYTTDGTAKNLEVDTTKLGTVIIDGVPCKGNDINPALEKLVYSNKAEGTKNPIQKRVVKYKVSSSTGRVIALEVQEDKMATGDFKAASGSLGTLKMSEATKVVDAIDYNGAKKPVYSDLSISSLAGFVDDNSYTAYAYDKSKSDGTYSFVIVVDAGGTYNADTMFAVLTKTPSSGTDTTTGDDIYTIDALCNGEETKLIANDDADVTKNGTTVTMEQLVKGDVIVFVKDNKGNLKTIDALISAEALGITGGYSEVAKALTKATTMIAPPRGAKNWTGSWTVAEDKNNTGVTLDMSKDVTRLVFGPIVEKKNSYFKLGSVAKATDEIFQDETQKYTGFYTNIAKESGIGGAIDISITDKTRVYVLDYSVTNTKVQLFAGSTADIMAASIADSLLLSNRDVIPWSNANVSDGANFAFAKVVDGTATDVFVILSK